MVDRGLAKQYLKTLQIPLDIDFSIEDVKSSYRLMAKFYHPDSNKTNDKESMTEINIAYDFIMKNYDNIKSLKFHEIYNKTNLSNEIENNYVRDEYIFNNKNEDNDNNPIELNHTYIILIILPFTNALGIDRFVIGDTKWGLIRLVIGIISVGTVGLILWLIDLLFLLQGRYQTDMLKYLI